MEEKESGGGDGGEGGFYRSAKRARTEEEAGGRDLEEGEEKEEETGSTEEDAAGRGCSDSRSRRSAKKDCVKESHLIPPSPVVHVRGLCDAVVEADLVEVLEKFGTICYVMMMPFKRQALVEFDSLESAKRCVTCGGSEPIFIANQQAFFNFSTSQRITRPTNADDPSSRNKVLLLSIQNPLYPISTDVLYTVCNPVGNVLRIVIFKRNGIQAMVEFQSVEDAQKAKMALNGADIYSGCCTLKIEYARIGEKEGSVKPSWESIHPMATALPVPCCPCLLTADTEEAMSQYRNWSPTNNSSQRHSPPPFLPPIWDLARLPW